MRPRFPSRHGASFLAAAVLVVVAGVASAQDGTGMWASERVATPLGANGVRGLHQADPTQATGGLSLGNLAGRLAPGSSANTGNIAGVLSYCVQNNQVDTGNASSTLSSLTGRNNVTSQPGYQLGQKGQLQTSNGGTMSLASLGGPVKQRICNAVLKQAKSLL